MTSLNSTSSFSSLSSNEAIQSIGNYQNATYAEDNARVAHVSVTCRSTKMEPEEVEKLNFLTRSNSQVMSKAAVNQSGSDFTLYLGHNRKARTHKDFHLPVFCKEICKSKGYLIDESIGYGTYGKVYRAVNVDNVGDRKTVAIKVMDKSFLSKQYKYKFLGREVSALLTIAPHPNVVQIFDVFKCSSTFQDGTPPCKLITITMEYCHNSDLYQYLNQRNQIPEKHSCRWFRQLLSGVGHIHQSGFAHRDLKLENLLLDYDYNLKITDFGFCSRLKDCNTCCKCGKNPVDSISNKDVLGYVKVNGKNILERRSETFCGSVLYTSPELLQGLPYLATLNDVWSCGVVLYLMMYGNYPFDDEQYQNITQVDVNFCPKVTYPKIPQVSKQCQEMFANIFVAEKNRLNIEKLQQLEWVRDFDESNMQPLEDEENLHEHFEKLNIPRNETLSFSWDEEDSIG